MGTSSLKKNEAFPKWGHAPSEKTRLSINGDILPQKKGDFPQKFETLVASKSNVLHSPTICPKHTNIFYNHQTDGSAKA